MSRRTVDFHFVHMPSQAGQSCPLFSSTASAAGKRNESQAQPDTPAPTTSPMGPTRPAIPWCMAQYLSGLPARGTWERGAQCQAICLHGCFAYVFEERGLLNG